MPSFWAFVLVFIIGIGLALSLASAYRISFRAYLPFPVYHSSYVPIPWFQVCGAHPVLVYRCFILWFPSYSMIPLLALSGHMFSFPVNGIGYWPSVHKEFYVNLSSRLWIHSIPIPFPFFFPLFYLLLLTLKSLPTRQSLVQSAQAIKSLGPGLREP